MYSYNVAHGALWLLVTAQAKVSSIYTFGLVQWYLSIMDHMKCPD